MLPIDELQTSFRLVRERGYGNHFWSVLFLRTLSGVRRALFSRTEAQPGKDGLNYAHAPAAALRQVLAPRVHLDHSTAANGPLRALPGTHGPGVLTDEAIRQRAGKSQGIACTVASGGVVAMRPLLLHASSKSLSDQPQRVVHFEYAASLGIGDGLDLAVV